MTALRQSAEAAGVAAGHGVAVGSASWATYWLVTQLLRHVGSVSKPDDLLGGMWAVVATVFVYRTSHQDTIRVAVSRTLATAVSLVLCLIYLLLAGFHVWALAGLIAISVTVPNLAGRPGDATTAAITTTVVLVVAAVSPNHAWQEPILRMADTLIGIGVGVTAVLATGYVTKWRERRKTVAT